VGIGVITLRSLGGALNETFRQKWKSDTPPNS